MIISEFTDENWLKIVSQETTRDVSEQTVAVDRFGEIFHNPDELASLDNMETMDIFEAAEEGISACGQCFPEIASCEEVIGEYFIKGRK